MWNFLLCVFLFLLAGCNQSIEKNRTYAIRLKPGQDLYAELQKFVNENNIQAGWIATCAGSLTDYKIRFANQEEGSVGKGHFEIVSLSGTLSVQGSHIHIAISDGAGKTTGGHLLEGCKIYTTAEIVIRETMEFVFTRENDGSTPWKELQIKRKP